LRTSRRHRRVPRSTPCSRQRRRWGALPPGRRNSSTRASTVCPTSATSIAPGFLCSLCSLLLGGTWIKEEKADGCGAAATWAGEATPGLDLPTTRSVCPSVKPPYRGIRAADSILMETQNAWVSIFDSPLSLIVKMQDCLLELLETKHVEHSTHRRHFCFCLPLLGSV
jgi:hypothetical protein